MRIVIDIQGCQSEGSRSRGIGRYSLSFVKSLIRNFSEHEYILFANSSLYDSRMDFSEELQNRNLNVNYFNWFAPGPFNYEKKGRSTIYNLAVQLRSYAIANLDSDLILITSFFEGSNDSCIIDFDKRYSLPPILSILYDLIPLLNQKKYLDSNPDFKSFYFERINYLNDLSGLLAISKSSLIEAKKYLNIDHDLIFNISSACDQTLFKKNKIPKNNNPYYSEYLGEYILYTGAGDPRKNLLKLIEAYALLPSHLIAQHKLVLAGKLIPAEIQLLYECLHQLNIPKEYVVILGFVTDKKLVELYSNCYLFIFPSLHEGFGLPVLEAMSCGAAVIGSDATSIPEIICKSDALFDPYDAEDISDVINRALQDNDFYNELKLNAIDRSKAFSWDRTASLAMNAIEKCLSQRNQSIKSNLLNFRPLAEPKFILFETIKLFKQNQDIIFDKTEYLQNVASSIDLIDKQLKYINSQIDKSNIISSWKVEGPFDSSYSLALLNREFASSIYKRGINVCLSSMEGNGYYQPNNFFLEKNQLIEKLYKNSLNKDNSYEITSRNLYPPTVDNMNSKLNIFHSYGWEESQFPFEWTSNFNQYLDGISVMSDFVRKILITNGIDLPIVVSGLGIDHIDSISQDENFKINAKSFRFLHISSCFPRKGIKYLLQAYQIAFTSSDDVSLVIKTFPNPHNEISSILDDFRKNNKDFPDVVLLLDDISDSQLKNLYLSCHVFVAPSLGEGFGLPIGEAMFLGLPVITTSWGGQMDFCTPENSWLIDYKYAYSETHFGLTSSVWALPDVQQLSFLMKQLYECDSDELTTKIDNAKKTVSNFTWSSCSQKNIDFVNSRLLQRRPVNPIIGWISTWNSRCGIASYSKNLSFGIDDLTYILAPSDELLEEKDEINVRRCWNLNSPNLDSLFKEINNNHISSLVIQFNFGFFELIDFINLINKAVKDKKSIIIFMHSTIKPNQTSQDQFDDLINIFRICNAVFVHTPSDMNRLKDSGLVDNVFLFPHGIIDEFETPKKNNFELILKGEKSLVLSSFGFCLPNKGLEQLIHSIPYLLDKGLSIELKLYSSIYNSKISTDLFDNLTHLIEKTNLSDIITINGDFLTVSESIDYLSSTDLIVLPYQESNESSSAAVRHALASGTAVAVTPLSIFQDVHDLTFTLPGFTSQLIAEGIYNLVSKNNLMNGKIKTIQKWYDQNKFSLLSKRLEGFIKAIEREKIL